MKIKFVSSLRLTASVYKRMADTKIRMAWKAKCFKAENQSPNSLDCELKDCEIKSNKPNSQNNHQRFLIPKCCPTLPATNDPNLSDSDANEFYHGYRL